MTAPFVVGPVPAPERARHDHMVRRFSRRAELIFDLRRWAAERTVAAELVRAVCAELDAPVPDVTFHRRRSPHTGYAQAPRRRAVMRFGEPTVRAWEEQRRRRWPETGMLRFGDPASLDTIAHELAHHLVHHHEPLRTRDHRKVWVAWYDRAAVVVAALAPPAP